MRVLSRVIAIPLALALLAAQQAPETPEPDLTALAIPIFPGMRYESGTAPPAGHTAPRQESDATTPVLTGLLRYTSSESFEEVAAFYERALGTPDVRVKTRDLTVGRRGQEIPAAAQGRRRLFRVENRDGARTEPVGGDPSEVMQQLMHRVLGATNVLVSDHGLDPETGALRATTTIEILLFR